MTSARVRRHLQSNVVGYVALFVALSGTALALPGKKRVDSNDLRRGAVKSKAIAKAAVKGKDLAGGAVSTPKLRTGAVSSAKLAPGAVLEGNLADAAVTSPKLATDSVVRQKIVQGTINGGKIANGAINSAKVNDGSLLAEDFAAGQISAGLVPAQVPGEITLPRAGSVFVIATAFVDCGGPVDCEIAAEVDGTAVPGATLNVPSGADAQFVLIGVTEPLAAGAHSVAIDPGGSATDEARFAGVLLQ